MRKKPLQQSLFDSNQFSLTQEAFREKLKQEFISAKKPLILKSQKKSRLDEIYLPELNKPIPTSARDENVYDYPDGVFPPIDSTERGVRSILDEGLQTKRVGLDFEFTPSTGKISIIGMASVNGAAACRYTHELGLLLLEAIQKGVVFVGHFVLGADKEILEKNLGLETPLSGWSDSMIWHYLLHAELTKKPGKEESEGAAGFMGLGFASHLWTNLPSYKSCRGVGCFGPCPRCRVFQYCACDAWAGLIIDTKARQEAAAKNIPLRVYDEHAYLALNFCIKAQTRGLDLDHEYIKTLNEKLESKKASIFPDNEPFNPRSDKQVKEFFKARGFNLPNTMKDTIERAVEKIISPLGIEDIDAWNNLSSYDRPEVEGPEAELIKLLDYKTIGKGIDAWFDDKFIGKDRKLHPRWVFTGASTMRLSSSSPNCFSKNTEILTNRGWIFFPELLETDTVAQYNTKDGEISFVIPDGYICGEVESILSIKTNDNIALEVTENHDCLIQNRKTGKFRKVKAINYPEDSRQIQGGVYKGGNESWDEWQVIIQTALQADGCVRDWGVDFGFKKQRKIDRMRMALNAGSIIYKEYGPSDRGIVRFYISKINFPAYFKKFWGEWLLEFNRATLDLFIKEFLLWDGCWTRQNHYSSSVKTNADWVQIIYTLSNYRARLRTYIPPSTRPNYQVDILEPPHSMTTNRTITREIYNDYVYCVTVPHGNVVVRNGKNVAITGNCQNARGKEIKRAFLPPKGMKFVAADAKNLELRIALWLSGVDINTIGWDAFKWILDSSEGCFDKAAAIAGKTPRQIAKITSYLTLYFGGFTLIEPWELETARVQGDIKKGILVVCEDWLYQNKIVAFTGKRLADFLFRNHTYESRKKALEIQELYFSKFPLRNFHKLSTSWAEKGYCQTPWGSRLDLIEGGHDDPKVASSKLGQGIGAEYVQGKQIWYLQNSPYRDIVLMQAQVHDEILWAVPQEWTDLQIKEFALPLSDLESHRYPGLKIPWDVSVGQNWGELRKLNDEKTGEWLLLG